MKTIKLSPNVQFTTQEYAGQGNAILGIRGSGKSYTATFLAERLLDDSIPFVAFDPIGVWRFLKTPGRGDGYPVVVAGDGGDLPLNVTSAPEIVRAAMRDNIPLVIDLYSMTLSKADWRKIVAACINVLLYENKNCGLRHIFLEEAAEFCPQRVGPEQGVVYSVIEKLARMGRNASLGYTLINQRGEEVNKAVLENCDCLFLHRQKGRNSLTALQKWIDFSAGGKAKEIVMALPGLPAGQCFAWLPGSDSPELVKVPEKRTFHPDHLKPELKTKALSANVDVTKFVGQLEKTLPKIAEEVAANDPKVLHQTIKELKRQLTSKGPAPMDPAVIEKIRKEAQQLGYQYGFAIGHKHRAEDIALRLTKEAAAIPTPAEPSWKTPGIVVGYNFKKDAVLPAVKQNTPNVERSAPKMNHSGSSVKLPEGERAILTVCAQNGDGGATREELTVITGYKRSTRDAYIQRLRSQVADAEHAPYVELQGDRVIATPEGIAALGSDFKPLPTGPALQEHWLQELPEGERKILEVLITHYPRAVSRDSLEQSTGFKRSTRDAYIQRLSNRRLVNAIGRGEVKASEILF